MSFAPSDFIRSNFDFGAVSTTTTVHRTPVARAAYATPWPAFPALIVQTPCLRSASDNAATALAAPRNLYALIGCRFSSFRRISGNSGPSSRRISGVRTIVFAIRSRAAYLWELNRSDGFENHRFTVEAAIPGAIIVNLR